ncbi:MAG: hypothetical protein K5675_01615 [Lachnospiraceae bacterium]|nr:hypothetical protein [Lachnospiraceae bacterium]
MENKVNIYFDMDGVQAVYGRDDSVEQMEEKGYFLNRPVQKNIIELMQRMKEDSRFHVAVLSAVFEDDHSAWEKLIWLENQNLGDMEKFFVPCGSSKASYVDQDGINILIDDFTVNLMDWENAGRNFHGIKFENGINGHNGVWKSFGGQTIHHKMDAKEMYDEILDYVDKLETALK